VSDKAQGYLMSSLLLVSARRFTFNLTEKGFMMKKNFKCFIFCVAALFAFHNSSIEADGHAGEGKPGMMMLEPMTEHF
jgi:hypothetical protein